MASRKTNLTTSTKQGPKLPPGRKGAGKKSAALEVRLAELAQVAWTQLRADHPEERFYFYALYTTEDGAYAVPTAWSEEALLSVLKDAQAKRPGDDVAELERTFRFSAPDSPYHQADAAGFDALPSGRRLLTACTLALRRLDEAGFFGEGRAREQVIVNVVFGDMSDDQWMEHAEALNPEASTQQARKYLRIVEPKGDVRTFGGRAYQVNALSLAADGKRLAYSGSGGEIGILELRKNPKNVLEKRRSGEHWASVLSPDGRTLYLGDRDGVHVLEVKTGEKALFARTGKPSALAISDDGRRLALSSWDSPVSVYSTDARERVLQFGKRQQAGLAFSPNGKHLAVTVASKLSILEVETSKTVADRDLDSGFKDLPVAWARDGSTLAVVSPRDGGILLLTWPGLEKAGAALVSGDVDAVTFSPSGERIAACVGDALVVFDRTGREIGRGNGKQEQLCACVMASDTEVFAVGRDVNSGPAVLALSI